MATRKYTDIIAIIDELYEKKRLETEKAIDKEDFKSWCLAYYNLSNILLYLKIIETEFNKNKTLQVEYKIPFSFGIAIGTILKNSESIPEIKKYAHKLWNIYQKYENLG